MRAPWLVVLAGCGRLGFSDAARVTDAAAPDATDAADDAVDAPPPCGPFGTVKAMRPFGGTIVDTNDAVVTPAGIQLYEWFSTGPRLDHLDHALAEAAVPTPMVVPSGNAGLSYDLGADRLYAYQTASTNAQIAIYTGDGATKLLGPVTSGANTAAGFVDAQHHLHLPGRVTSGIREYDPSLGLVTTWGTTVLSGTDLELDHTTGTAYHTSAAGKITPFDLATRLPGASFPFPNPDGIAIDEPRQILYVNNRTTRTLYALRPDGSELAHVVLVDDPTALAYDPVSDRLVVGFYFASGTSELRLLCPFVP